MEELKTKENTIPAETVSCFDSERSFELVQRMAKLLSSSALVPAQYQNNIPNTVIALEMAHRVQASPLAVMQNLYIVHGKPSWSGQFVIAAVNSTGKFSPIRFDMAGDGDGKTCTAWAIEKTTGERLESPSVSIKMAKAEGWYQRNGSKWQTMPELMMRYRAATFFGRLYAPEVLMGMQASDEVEDVEIVDARGNTTKGIDGLKARLKKPSAEISNPVETKNADLTVSIEESLHVGCGCEAIDERIKGEKA